MNVFRNGMGFMVDGAFPVPDNPILLGVAQRSGMQGINGLGDLVKAAFPIPQNPITAATSMDTPKVLTPPVKRNALVRSLTAAQTGPVANQKGMGDAASTLQSVGAVLDNTVSVGGTTIPYWVFAIGALGAAVFLMGGKSGPSRYQRFRAAY